METDREYCSKEVQHSTNSSSNTTSTKAEKSKRNHAVLIQWLETHHEKPYPTKTEKHYLACYANMTQRQLNDWFANARRNIKKIGFAAWKAKHSPALVGVRSRRHLPATVQTGGSGVRTLTSTIDTKATYRFQALYPPPATAKTISQSGNYLPTTTRGILQLPIMNRANTPTHFGGNTSSTPTTLFALYPPHSSSHCSCSHCAVPAALSSHTLGTMPVFSGFNSSDILKYDIGLSSSYIPLSHVSDVLPCTQAYSMGNVINHYDNQGGMPNSSSQQRLKDSQTPPDTKPLNVCKCSPSSIRSGTPLEPQFSSTSPCPTLPTSSESASIAIGYKRDACKSTISASSPEHELCAMNQIVYDSRPETKPLFHLPNNNLECMTSSSPDSISLGSHPQWAVNTTSMQSLYEAELPILSETHNDGIKVNSFTDPPKEEMNQATTQLCVDQASCA